MDALEFLKEKEIIAKNDKAPIIVGSLGIYDFDLVEVLEEFKERILNPVKPKPKYKIGEKVYIKKDSSGKRYTVKDFNANNVAYLLQNVFGETTWEREEFITDEVT